MSPFLLNYFNQQGSDIPDFGFQIRVKEVTSMSKRTDKKRQKRFNEVHPTTTAPAAQPVVETAAPAAEPVPEVTVTETTAPVNAAPAYDLFIQYQNGEYDAAVLAEKILDKCKAEGMDSSDLKIYVKPEDKKAYYACAGGTGAIELA